MFVYYIRGESGFRMGLGVIIDGLRLIEYFMRSSNVEYLPKLDHLRFLAALLVFSFHFIHYFFLHWQSLPSQPWLSVIVEGHTGVGLFFTLSGFLFMLIGLKNENLNYKKFIINRFLRIFPLFLVVFCGHFGGSRSV